MTVRLVVRGRVQGVGFRYFVLRKATELELSGFTRNLADGTVEIVVRGPVDRLAALESAALAGPRYAQVAGVDKSEISDEVELPKSFSIN
jgi:acylphosphatase